MCSIIHPGETHWAVISSTSVKLIKVQPLFSSTSSQPPHDSETLVIHPGKLNNNLINQTQCVLARACSPSCQMSFDYCVGAVQFEAWGAGRLPGGGGGGHVELSPILASGPITQLTCLLTRSPYLCCTALSVPGCLYSWRPCCREQILKIDCTPSEAGWRENEGSKIK